MSRAPIKVAEFDVEKIADLCLLVYRDRLGERDVAQLQAEHGAAEAERIFRSRGKAYDAIVRSVLRSQEWMGFDVSAFK